MDLPLLATRHATSKLQSVNDFNTLQTFGFRGEAIASTSMVSRLLTVTTRTATSNVGYTQTYQNGKPLSTKPKPCARQIGTTIVVQDLFYNVQHRLRAYSKRESDEYNKILQVIQQYSIHYPTIGFVCQRRTKSSSKSATGKSNNPSSSNAIVDCNTSQIPAVKALLQSRDDVASKNGDTTTTNNNNNNIASEQQQTEHKEKIINATKQVLSHVLETNLFNHLLYMDCSSSLDGNEDDNNHESTTTTTSTTMTSSSSSTQSDQYKFQYRAEIYFTTPSYNSRNNQQHQQQQQQGKFILFLNDRLIDLPPLKRSMEDVYGDFGGTTGKANTKPVLVVNLFVPGTQVDVNVHPSKRQVALMYQEDIINSITTKLRQQLERYGQTFATQSVGIQQVRNPYAKDKQPKQQQKQQQHDDDGGDDDNVNVDTNDNKNKRKTPDDNNDDDEESNGKSSTDKMTPEKENEKVQNGSSNNNSSSSSSNNNSNTADNSMKKQKIAPSKLIRTHKATPAGAIEPFLVSTQITPTQKETDQALSPTQDVYATSPRQQDQHISDCPLSTSSSSVDMSQPGAFADAFKCSCPPDAARRSILVKQPTKRPKRVIPTQCSYASIVSLRKRVHKQQCTETTQQLRQAFFMGVMSHQRSLIQCGEELVMINHLELAKELFYQLALARFGGAPLAHLGDEGIHIHTAIAQALQCEDDLATKYDGGKKCDSNTNINGVDLLEVNDMNHNLAKQATMCLIEHADMLDEYFSIRIEKADRNNILDATLTGMPILLEGHCPEPHGLSIFLLRLATQVDWSEERPCFHAICKELGYYYAMLPSEEEDLNAFVQHNLFPALSYLLLPSKQITAKGYYNVMTKLSTLYKVFERC